MSDRSLPAQGSSWAEFSRKLGRQRALVALVDLERQKRFALRAARLYAFCVFVAYAWPLVIGSSGGRAASIHGIVQSALIALSFGVGAPAALATARILAEQSERSALVMLAVQRGHSARSLRSAQLLAAATRIARLVAAPALLLVALGLARGAPAPWALAMVPAVSVYAAALGLGLALLAQFSAELAPRHARAMLAALVLGPSLMAQAIPHLPSVLGFYSAALSRLLDWGTNLS